MRLALAALMVMGVAVRAEAADTLGLEKGLFGLSWGESSTAIRSRFPKALVTGSGDHIASMGVKGNFSFEGHAIDVISVAFDPRSGRLDHVSFDVAQIEQNALLQKLTTGLGEPRLLSLKEATTYSHTLEWSRPQFSVSVWAATKGPKLTDAAVMPVVVRVQQGPLIESQIELAEKRRKALGERLRKMKEQHP